MEERKIVRCKACRRRLTSSEAITAGFGPVCYRKLFGRSLSCSTKGSNTGQNKIKLPRKSAKCRIPINQISVFDMQEGRHGSDTQESG